MNRHIIYIFSLIFIVAGCQDVDHLLKQGDELVGVHTPLNSFELVDASMENHYGSIKIVPSDNQGFDSAFVITVEKMTIFSYDLMMVRTIDAELKKGEIVYIEFYAKAVRPKPQTSIGQISVKFSSFLIFPLEIDTIWRKYASYALVEKDVAASESQLRIECGFEPQVVSVAKIRFYKFSPDFDVKKLTGITPLYNPDPDWEKDADIRIDSLRKGNAEFFLTDEKGNPLPSCDFNIEMLNHAFKWGTAVSGSFSTDTSANGEKYKQMLKQDFNHVVFENNLKWISWENPDKRADIFKSIQWLHKNGFEIRGHCLVWPWYDFPRQKKKLGNDTSALKKAIYDHIVEESTALKGKLMDWDVLNEPFVAKDTNDIWIYQNVEDLVGTDEIIKWFVTVHAIDPGARLFINDFDILSDGALFEIHKDHYEEMISMLIRNKAPLQGIGYQGHFEGTLTPPEKVYEVLDRFGKYQLPMLITEFDLDMSAGHEEEMYQFMHDLLKVCFSHPYFDGFLNWGFWAGHHWKPRTAFYDENWQLRPNGKAWKDLIYNEWWTREAGKTGADGKISFRGFYGDYKITYSLNGREVEKTFRFTKQGVTWL